jgi:hypothetical protein
VLRSLKALRLLPYVHHLARFHLPALKARCGAHVQEAQQSAAPHGRAADVATVRQFADIDVERIALLTMPNKKLLGQP